MRRLMIVAAAAVSMVAVMTGGNARAAAMPDAGVATAASGAIPLQKVQYVWGGRNYCWYGNGWQGPGWYWCGYPWRTGFGWGGGYGWNGWGGRGGGWRGGGWHGGGGHGGGWH
ncbi:MAG: hypothetical protein WBF00_05785, partial [Methylocella sp.]